MRGDPRVGVGKCRQHGHKDGAVMCPSYQATMDEEHSPRGRSRLLFEMLDGHGDSTITDGWRSEAVRDALDLCLACKGCKSDCPGQRRHGDVQAGVPRPPLRGAGSAPARTMHSDGSRCTAAAFGAFISFRAANTLSHFPPFPASLATCAAQASRPTGDSPFARRIAARLVSHPGSLPAPEHAAR